MSDFLPRDILPDLWEEILQRHWTYLETEDGMQKLEERKKLEGCLKDFLCIVPHDRKFFLPETAHVLKKSIKDMDDFSAYKAMIGFESISQYANNLFTKPWRKEYRYIKMFSGFYAHDIGSNLVDADKLFEAMGYKQLPDQTLMLDGPICPDQVTNVSRDAMAAYVECQIMKQIFSGLTSSELSCSWQNIFNFRESHIGGSSQAVRAIAYAAHERRFRKEKMNSENCYATIQQPQQPPMVSSCGLCTHDCHPPQISQMGNGCNHHSAQQQFGGMCSIHSQPAQNIYMQNPVAGPHHFKTANFVPPQMSHSKSLEHYGDHNNSTGIVPHRHSFDQPYDNGRPHYDSVYDCVDGYQSCNFNAYNHPYNRYPLPYNISNQLNNQFPTTCAVNNINQYPPPPPPPPAIVTCSHKVPINDPNQMYGDCNGFLKKPQEICNYHTSNGKDVINYRQCNHGPNNGRPNNVLNEQLIDFDDRPNEYNRPHNNFDFGDQTPLNNRQYKSKQTSQQQSYDIPRAHLNSSNQTLKDLYGRNRDSLEDIAGNNVYGMRQNDRKPALKKDKFTRNAEILEQYEKAIDNKEQSGQGRTYDSYEDAADSNSDIVNGIDSARPNMLSNKNHDGVGSFEAWDYVFQNLEKHGYTKDLGERGDLLMRGLDLDSMNVSTATEKRRSRNLDAQKSLRPTNDATVKSKTLEKSDLVKESNVKPNVLEKSILKHDNETVQKTITKTTQVQKSNQPLAATVQKPKISKILINNNNNESNEKQSITTTTTAGSTPATVVAASTSQRRQYRSTGTTTSVATSAKSAKTVPQIAAAAALTTTATNPSEWGCRFCTYLNPDTKRICEMCCRSKDFVSDASNAPTCV